MSKIIDGKKISLKIKDELREKVSKLKVKPKLVVISVGDNPASKVYVRQKEKCAKYIGFDYLHMHFDSISDDDLIREIGKLNKDDSVSGMIVQLPLPKGMDEKRIVNSINVNKDVDGLTYLNAGKLLNNEECLTSCTPSGIMELLKAYNVDPCGKNAVVIGRSILVGKPMMNLLINTNATVTLCHSKTIELKKITRKADILVVAIGKPNFVTRDMVKRGSVIIDVGINRVDDKLIGDVNYLDVKDKVKLITPVPGGVGPMTVVMLMNNVYKAYLKNKNN
ncbi:MAG: bifunctional methylenetetrahydrofolate dehydrogenase/methenyltetrahydrofolate cyclohydrolase FolD [Bacilli bacterium]|nr:bifunctional methylenetetrahydrofolate dehydrogenase/methenyltetrahydrofolate cyclohydrolase FolD [Bacilli bacterium]